MQNNIGFLLLILVFSTLIAMILQFHSLNRSTLTHFLLCGKNGTIKLIIYFILRFSFKVCAT